MKKTFLLSLISLIILSSMALAECTDTDGGNNIYEKGTTDFYGILSTDECSEYKDSVYENYCTESGVTSVLIKCPDVCEDGACIQEVQDECTVNSDCNDNDKSTNDLCTGSPKECSNTKITQCIDDDNYCPSGCSYQQDDDCDAPDQCSNNADCDDSDVSTKNLCGGSPKKCSYEKITECLTGDNYCPVSCTYNLDKDCQEADQCSIDTDCNDNDESTNDLCTGSPKKCSYVKTKDCVSGDDYCPSGCLFKQDNDCPQCSVNTDCNDNNPCTKNICENSKCVKEIIKEGCALRGSCISVGVVYQNNYCDSNSKFKYQKSVKESCDNDYECLSNICEKNVCIKQTLLRIIKNWFVSFFSN